MKLERQDDAEIEKFLGQIPHATPLSFHRHECDNHRCHNLPLHHGHGHERHGHGHGHVGNGIFQGGGNEHKHPIHRHVNGHDDDRHGGYHHHHVLGGHGHGDTTNNKRTVHQLHGINDDDPSCHGHVCVSSVTPSDGSSSSSASGRHSPEDGSPLVPPYDFNLKFPTEDGSHPNGFYFPESRDLPGSRKEVDELGLSEKLWAMGIVDNEEEESKLDPYTTQLGANNGNAVTNLPNLAMHDPARSLLTLKLKLQQHYQTSNLPGTQRLNTLFPDREPEEFMNSSWTKAKEQPANDSFTNLRLPSESGFGAAQYRPAVQVPYFTPPGHNLRQPGESGFGAAQYRPAVQVPYFTSSGHRHYNREVYLLSPQNGCDFRGDWDMFSSLNSPQFTPPNQSLGMNSCENLLHYSLPMYTGGQGQGQSPQSHSTMQAPRNFETSNDEGSFILQGKYLNYVVNRQRMGFSHHQLERQNSVGKNFELNYNVGHVPRPCSPFLPTRYSSLLGIQGKLYYAAKDQQGCRFLQSKVNEGAPHDVQMIFKEIIDYVAELMVNPFGNYLVQKLLEVCNKEERMQIVHVVTREPGELVKISLNTHGTRAVQKLIETINTQQEVSLIVSALEPGFLDLIKDLNGNHVVQRCLQYLTIEDNKFIFYASAKHCVDIATHRHGCCVLQRCIAHSTGKYRENLVAEISGNGLRLAQDSFGNYVVQYILDLNNPSAAATLMSQFEGNYVHLSMQKSSSNVVEKCLHVFKEEGRSRIIHELLSTSQFDRLLQDPFANYVIQSALEASKGPLHDSLIEAIRPHAQGLRTSPYCKRIITRTLLKK